MKFPPTPETSAHEPSISTLSIASDPVPPSVSVATFSPAWIAPPFTTHHTLLPVPTGFAPNRAPLTASDTCASAPATSPATRWNVWSIPLQLGGGVKRSVSVRWVASSVPAMSCHVSLTV